MRAVVVATLCLAITACGPAAAVAKQRPHRPSACQKLRAGYKDLAPSRELVLVVRGGDETGRIAACVLPRGRVRTVTSWDDGLGRDGAAVVRAAGTWVLYEETHNDQYGGTSRALLRFDARRGTRLGLAGYGCMLGYQEPHCPDGTAYGEVGMAASGAGAFEITDLATETTTLRGFAPGGAVTTLATGPVDALRVTHAGVTWTQDGVAQSAPLPAQRRLRSNAVQPK
jgi:hypothetical protein